MLNERALMQYTKKQQAITALSFFLSSGAAVSLIANGPAWLSFVLLLTVAAASAYALAVTPAAPARLSEEQPWPPMPRPLPPPPSPPPPKK